MNIADEIKSRLTMDDLFAAYGFEKDRGGFIRCPFHSEKTPSLSAYDHGTKWKCFGCGESGDVISFVEKLYNLNFGQAVLRLDTDFGLGLSTRTPGRRQKARLSKALMESKKAEAEQKTALNDLTCYRRTLWGFFQNKKPSSMEEAQHPDFALALRELDYLDCVIMEMMKERR